MSSEYWQKMQAVREAMESNANALAEIAEQEQQKRELAISIVTSIFEAIRNNDPRIQATPASNVDRSSSESYETVSLKWGKKLGVTSEDRDIMASGTVDQMLFYDYSYISAQVQKSGGLVTFPHIGKPFFREDFSLTDWSNPENSRVVSNENYSLDHFITDPSIAFPALVKMVDKPMTEHLLVTRRSNPQMFNGIKVF